MESLPHLHASMREKDRAISVHMQQGSCLVQEGNSKCQTVLVRTNGQPSLLPLVAPEKKSLAITFIPQDRKFIPETHANLHIHRVSHLNFVRLSVCMCVGVSILDTGCKSKLSPVEVVHTAPPGGEVASGLQ